MAQPPRLQLKEMKRLSKREILEVKRKKKTFLGYRAKIPLL